MQDQEKDREIHQLRETVSDLQRRISQLTVVEQHLKNVRHKLDAQIETFTHIHQYAMKAFGIHEEDDLFGAIAEGIVDVFQLEVSAVFSVEHGDSSLELRAGCNLEMGPQKIFIPEHWIEKHDLMGFYGHKAQYEAPVTDLPWSALHLSKAVFMPIYDNHRQLAGIIMGGITRHNCDFYDMVPKEIISPFMVYCQQMIGIWNNLIAVRQASQASNAKTRFLANLSHEIRTPMNAIIGMAQIADRSSNEEQIRGCIRKIDTSSRHLLALINDVLDLSKIEEGKMSLAEEPFCLSTTLDDVLASILPKAQEKGQSITVECAELCGREFLGDSMRISQVLLNLLSNAVKFSPEGDEICLTIAEGGRDQEHMLLRFTVADHGIGMSREYQARMFSPFEQADNSISRKYGGTGLGLAISQRIVDMMGGRIHVESHPGKGSIFSFGIWLKPSGSSLTEEQDKGAQGGTMPDFRGFNLLVVDDVDINREIIDAFLDETGISIEHAQNGQEAVDMVFTSDPGYYDIVLMDIQMPVMDGLNATRAIRGSRRSDAKDIIILAMTANAFKEDVADVLDSGMNGHLAKPVEYDTVLNTLGGYLRNRPRKQEYDECQTAPPPTAH